MLENLYFTVVFGHSYAQMLKNWNGFTDSLYSTTLPSQIKCFLVNLCGGILA